MITQKIIARTDSLKLDKIISRYGEDSMRQVVFIIVRPEPDSEELIPITIPEDAVGSFRILKPSGNFVMVPMSKSVLSTGETAFDVVLPASANTAKGSGYYDIRITSETDKYYYTAQGEFIIDDNIISDDVLEDVSEVNGLIFPDDFLTINDNVAYIDDDTISTDSTWSSDKISDEIDSHGAIVSKTVSGNPLTFTDGADAPLVKCDVTIAPQQDLHGYTKPWVGGAGKNKSATSYATSTSTGRLTVNSGTFGGCVANTEYTISFDVLETNGISVDLRFNDTTPNINRWDTGELIAGNRYSFTYTPTVDGSFNFYTTSTGFTVSTIVIDNVQVEVGSTVTTYEPYSNICPITAYTEGEIEVGGRNRFKNLDPETVVVVRCSLTLSGNTYTMVCTANDACIGVYPNLDSTYAIENGTKQKCTPGQRLKIVPSNSNINKNYVAFYNENDVVFARERVDLNSFTVPQGAKYFTIRVGNALSGTNTYTFTLMVLFADDTDTTFTPYIEQTTHTTTFPTAIYRGSEDVVKGEVTSEWAYKSLSIDASAGTVLTNYRRIHLTSINDYSIVDRESAISDCLPYIYDYSGDYLHFYLRENGAGVYIFLPNDNTAYTVNICYPLATPIEIPITPTVIKLLLGYNTMWTDGDNLEVEYITQDYQPLVDLIESNTSVDVYSTTPQKVGKWFNGEDVYEVSVRVSQTEGGYQQVDTGISADAKAWIVEGYAISPSTASDVYSSPIDAYYSSANPLAIPTSLYKNTTSNHWDITYRIGSELLNGEALFKIRYVTESTTPTRSLNLTKSAVTEKSASKEELPDEIKNAEYEEKPETNEADDDAPTEVER